MTQQDPKHATNHLFIADEPVSQVLPTEKR